MEPSTRRLSSSHYQHHTLSTSRQIVSAISVILALDHGYMFTVWCTHIPRRIKKMLFAESISHFRRTCHHECIGPSTLNIPQRVHSHQLLQLHLSFSNPAIDIYRRFSVHMAIDESSNMVHTVSVSPFNWSLTSKTTDPNVWAIVIMFPRYILTLFSLT